MGVLLLLLSQSRGRAGRRSRSRNRRAQAGEAEAEILLEAEGFAVLERQVGRPGTMWIDGEPLDFEVRVDLVVEQDGQRFVAEVKTGDRAPDPGHPATRRQLREYAALFPDHAVLLVDVEAGTVVEVEFE